MKTPIQSARPRGFALVITLSLMILLTIIAVGLLTLSSIALRSSSQGENVAAAQANARLALMLAIGQLQRQAGPDQRVTAAASIVATPAPKNPNWTGVWATTERGTKGTRDPVVTRPVVGPYENPAYLTDLRESGKLVGGKWKAELRLDWLVSGENQNPAKTFDANEDVEIVGLGSVVDTTAKVWVPKVKLPGGNYAYWVADESTKVKVAVNHPYAGKSPDPSQGADGGYYRLAGAEPPNVTKMQAGSSTPYGPVANLDAKEREKLVDLPQVGLVVTPEDIRNNFHDMTTVSMAVLSNPRTGGLKKDLTTLLEQARTGASRGVSMSSNPLKVEQVLPETPIIAGNWHKFSGPRFDHLYAWYRLMDELTGSKVGEYSLAPRFLEPRAATQERAFYEGWTVNHLAKTGSSFLQMPVTLQPQLVDFKLQFDFTLDTSRAGGRAILTHIYPRLVLWNPYNVKLSSRRYVVMAPASYPWGGLQIGGKGIQDIAGDPNAGKLYPGASNGFAFAVEPIDFEPGECLVFTPKVSGTLIGGNSGRYDSDISKNVLSASKPADRQNFHFQSGKQVEASVDLSQPQIPYGIVQDVNAAIATDQFAFVLKRAPASGSIQPTDLYQNKDYATIARHICHYQGHGGYYWWMVPNMSNHPVNNAPTGFVTHDSNPERNPPRLWFTEARQRWFDESMENGSLSHNWGNASAVCYNVPLIAAYNVRAPIVHRSQFCYYNDWPQYTPGGFMIPWASEMTFGTPKEAPFVNNKAVGSPWGLAGDWAAAGGHYPMFDVPSPDVGVFSLAAFQHAELGFQTWLPSYVIGHSLAEARSDRNATARRDYLAVHTGAGSPTPSGTAGDKPWDVNFRKGDSGVWSDLVQAADQPNELQAYDITYETNHYLWDDYFLSTIPFKRGSDSPQIIWDVDKPLPNSRQRLNPWLGLSAKELAKNLTSAPASAGYRSAGAYPFHNAAMFLLNDGGFNVNSTSVEAWSSVLSSCRDLNRPALIGGGISGPNFSRLLVPRSSTSGATLISEGAWNSATVLTDNQIRDLATEIVKEVKSRGPFLSLSDFVNRRLTAGTALSSGGMQDANDQSVRGPLQAAIERSKLNQAYQQSAAMYQTNRAGKECGNGGGGFVTDYDAMPDWKTYGLPAYVTQADILQQLGSQLTVRGDTFIIRSYGEKTDANGKVLAKAWCEGVVQRLPEYVDGQSPNNYSSSKTANHPIEPLNIASGTTLTVNSQISEANLRFGRKFTLTSFRWLSPDEI